MEKNIESVATQIYNTFFTVGCMTADSDKNYESVYEIDIEGDDNRLQIGIIDSESVVELYVEYETNSYITRKLTKLFGKPSVIDKSMYIWNVTNNLTILQIESDITITQTN